MLETGPLIDAKGNIIFSRDKWFSNNNKVFKFILIKKKKKKDQNNLYRNESAPQMDRVKNERRS